MNSVTLRARALAALLVVALLLALGLFSLTAACAERAPGKGASNKLVFIKSGNIYVYNPSNGSAKRITSDGLATALGVRRNTGLIAFSTCRISDDGSIYTFETINMNGSGRKLIKRMTEAEIGQIEPVDSLAIAPRKDYMYITFAAHQLSDYLTTISRLNMKTGTIEEVKTVDAQPNQFETYSYAAVSPSGDKLACLHAKFSTSANANVKLCVMNVDGSNPRDIAKVVTGKNPVASAPTWSFDGKKIAYMSGASEVWSIGPDGKSAKKMAKMSTTSKNPDWSPGGSSIALNSIASGKYPPAGAILSVSVSNGEASTLVKGKDNRQPHWVRSGS